jgi:flavin reductase (DIM6/NTAB) family NADH-FMN oxidoreductase RutF
MSIDVQKAGRGPIWDVLDRVDRLLWVVTAQAGQARGGLIATLVSIASLSPSTPRMIVGMAKQHHTHDLAMAAGGLTLHLIRDSALEWIERFGLQDGREVDKLAGLSVRAGASGNPILSEAMAWLDCEVEATFDIGDKTLFLCAVVAAADDGQAGMPMTVRALEAIAPDRLRRRLADDLKRDTTYFTEQIRAWRAARPSASLRT